MSIKAIEGNEVYNDKDTVLAILQEFYLLGPVDLASIVISNAENSHKDCPSGDIVEHGLWGFCYHTEKRVMYLL